MIISYFNCNGIIIAGSVWEKTLDRNGSLLIFDVKGMERKMCKICYIILTLLPWKKYIQMSNKYIKSTFKWWLLKKCFIMKIVLVIL